MIKYILLISTILLFSACVNKTGISAKYYANECDEYYDVQGYYHKDCKDDNIVSYKKMGEKVDKAVEFVVGEEEIKEIKKSNKNVW